MTITVEYRLDLTIHKIHQQFDERLAFIRDARCCTMNDPTQKTKHYYPQQQGGHQCVHIQYPKAAVANGVCIESQMVSDIFGWCQLFCSHVHKTQYLNLNLSLFLLSRIALRLITRLQHLIR